MMNQQVNQKLPNGSTVLHNAARIGNVNNVRLLLSQGADVNAKDDDGKLPLDYATKKEIQKLLTNSANARLALPEFKAEQKLAEMKKNIRNEDDKSNIINGLIMNRDFYSDIDDATIEKLIEKLFNYNVNSNNEVATPATVAPIVTQTTTTSAAPTANTIVLSEASKKAMNDLKARVLKGDSIEDIISSLEHYDIESEIKNELIQSAFDNVNSRNEVAASAEVTQTVTTTYIAPIIEPAPAAVPATPAPVRPSPHAMKKIEEKLSADIKVRLFNGEDKNDVMASLFSFPYIKEETLAELVEYIDNYTHGVNLTGINMDFINDYTN